MNSWNRNSVKDLIPLSELEYEMLLEEQGSVWDKPFCEIRQDEETGEYYGELAKMPIIDDATKELLSRRFRDYICQTNENVDMWESILPTDPETGERLTDPDTGEDLPRVVCHIEYPKQAYMIARSLEMYAWQYDQLLRAQLTEFDPVVLEYVERVLDMNKTAATAAQEDKTHNYSSATDRIQGGTVETNLTRDLTSGKTLLQTGTRRVDVDNDELGEEKNARTLNTDEKTSDKDITALSGTDTLSNTGTDKTQRRGDDVVTGKGATQNLTANTPQSAVNSGGAYPGTGGSSTEKKDLGSLDWTYQDTQAEERTGNESRTDYNSDESVVHGLTQTTAHGKTETTTYGKNIHQGGTITDSRTFNGRHTDNDSLETRDLTDTETGTEGGTQDETETRALTDNSKTTQSDDAKKINKETRRDSGKNVEKIKRSGSPVGMLEMARNYIAGTNAFLWLCDKVEPCFLAVWHEVYND